MRNKFEIRGDVTAIFIESPKYGFIETLIATSDLPRAQEYPYKWSASWNKSTQSFYVTGKLYSESKSTSISLHRWIMEVSDRNVQVDHILHDTLDNCRWALRIVSNSENQQNARRNSRNKSGVTGVSWSSRDKKWYATIDVECHKKYLGNFESKDEAVQTRRFAEKVFHEYKQKIR